MAVSLIIASIIQYLLAMWVGTTKEIVDPFESVVCLLRISVLQFYSWEVLVWLWEFWVSITNCVT